MSLYSGRGSDTSHPSTDQLERDEWKRRSRNLSEKKRRDHFNTLITQLATMVSSNPKKIDKSTVLKATIALLKARGVSDKLTVEHRLENWKPPFLSDEEFAYLMLEALDGFLLVLSPDDGKVVKVSEAITALLGYLPEEIVDRVALDYVLAEERSAFFNFLQAKGHCGPDPCPIVIHFKVRPTDPGDPPTYALLGLTGYFKKSSQFDPNQAGGSKGTNEASIFVATARVLQATFLRQMSLPVDPFQREFSSRHSLEWKFLFLDQRAPMILGYLPFELLGTSAYDFVNPQDLTRLANGHQNLLGKGEGTSSPYRFLIKGQQWIWLQTRSFITYHQWNSKPEFIVATHVVLRSCDAMREVLAEGERK